jgi:hypothetical protein
VSLHE